MPRRARACGKRRMSMTWRRRGWRRRRRRSKPWRRSTGRLRNVWRWRRRADCREPRRWRRRRWRRRRRSSSARPLGFKRLRRNCRRHQRRSASKRWRWPRAPRREISVNGCSTARAKQVTLTPMPTRKPNVWLPSSHFNARGDDTRRASAIANRKTSPSASFEVCSLGTAPSPCSSGFSYFRALCLVIQRPCERAASEKPFVRFRLWITAISNTACLPER